MWKCASWVWFVAFTLTSCSAPATPAVDHHLVHAPTAPGSTPAGDPPARSFDEVSDSRRLPGGVVLDPPATSRPRVSAATAYLACAAEGMCDPRHRPAIELAEVSNPDSGTLTPDGGLNPVADHTLAYVLTWNSACAPVGPAGADHLIARCTFYDVVDATSGQQLFAFDFSQR